jgi:hypothetical protein
MSKLVSNYQVSINAEPEQVFNYVAYLTRHGEWSESLKVESVSEGQIGVGSQYHSTGRLMGKQVENDVRIVEYNHPTRLCFTASDGKIEFLQELTFSASNGGTLLERRVSVEMNPIMPLLFKVMIGPLVANPSMNKSLGNLKAKMESPAS